MFLCVKYIFFDSSDANRRSNYTQRLIYNKNAANILGRIIFLSFSTLEFVMQF
jgi:hypothetical protein